MGRAVSGRPGKFKPGDRVRVRMEDRPGHIRTPWYIRGKTGWIEQVHGEFLNPESLAHGGDGLPNGYFTLSRSIRRTFGQRSRLQKTKSWSMSMSTG